MINKVEFMLQKERSEEVRKEMKGKRGMGGPKRKRKKGRREVRKEAMEREGR